MREKACSQVVTYTNNACWHWPQVPFNGLSGKTIAKMAYGRDARLVSSSGSNGVDPDLIRVNHLDVIFLNDPD
ncbi:MAG: hypothetical protein QXO76_09620 [Thermoproteota archaeon]